MGYLDTLNTLQKAAVVHTEGPSLVIAGAGSGKTRVLTYRIAHLIKNGVPPSNILALTFTNKAAREMKERIASVVGKDTAKYLWMGTFHSIFARILRMEHETIGYPSNFTIYDTADSRALIKSILKHFELDEKIYKVNTISGRISMAKSNLITPDVYAQNPDIRSTDRAMRMPRIAEIYKEYTKRSSLSGAMDFDDLLLKTNILLRDHPEILEKNQDRFHYILVDEYQDTNYSQYYIIKKLAAKHRNICVVGDDAQSIYSFRGARIENILNFKNDYPEHEIFKLEQNYRSTQTIVNAANNIIAQNKRQIPKNVFSELEVGRPIKVFSALTDSEEGFLVANEISETMLRKHYKSSDYAILYRTNAQSRIFEEALRKRNISYKIYGGLSFYQRKEIKDLLAYFRLTVNSADNAALQRIINFPARGIGKTTLEKLDYFSNEQEQSMWDTINNLPLENPMNFNNGTIKKLLAFRDLINRFTELVEKDDAFTAANTIAIETGILRDLYNDKSPESVSKHENIQELLNAIQEFTINAKEEGTSDKLATYIEDVALLTDQDDEKEENRDKVTLMTIHAAKGLEFKNVFVVGMEEKLFPSLRDEETPESIEEERRLFYVAITRAKENAYLSYAMQRYRWGKLDFCKPSRFLQDIDEKFIESDAPLHQVVRSSATGDGSQGYMERNRVKTSAYKSPTTRSAFKKKLTSINNANQTNTNFAADDSTKIQTGMKVRHQRFGEGKVLKLEGSHPNIKATIFFNNTGQKQLLLKFAKLQIITD